MARGRKYRNSLVFENKIFETPCSFVIAWKDYKIVARNPTSDASKLEGNFKNVSTYRMSLISRKAFHGKYLIWFDSQRAKKGNLKTFNLLTTNLTFS